MNQEELKQKLTAEEFHVTQEKGTEAPFSGEYVHEKAKGKYACKVCGMELFSSDSKFDSGTGWPSFDTTLPNAVKFTEDVTHGMHRIEVTCATCGAHLGHMFEDGPTDPSIGSGQATGKRFCMNSCALDLKKE